MRPPHRYYYRHFEGSLVRELYRSRLFDYELKEHYAAGPVADLVWELELIARELGWTLSRWKTNGAKGYPSAITYALHPGRRPDRSANLPEESLVTVLNSKEGKGVRTEAFRKLSHLKAEAQKLARRHQP